MVKYIYQKHLPLRMKIKKKNMRVVVIFSVMLFIVSAYALSKDGLGDYAGEDQSDFAKCLSETGAVMYGSSSCGHCNEQKAQFGDAFNYINYVECARYQQECQEKGIKGVPTWIIDDEQYVGMQSLSALSMITGCSTGG